MFTGIVEAVGTLVVSEPGSGSTRMSIESSLPVDELVLGESIAVDGVCLTVVGREAGRFQADVVAETLARTTLGAAKVGDPVNLERALRVGDRLGGHWVQGHVDATAPVLGVRRAGDDWRVRVATQDEIARFVAFKGSVTLQGVSLTIASVDRDGFEVALVPHTLERTTLGRLRAGDRVNVETDLVARYLERILAVPETGRRSDTDTARRARDA